MLLVRSLIDQDLDTRTARLLPPRNKEIGHETFRKVRAHMLSGGYRLPGMLDRSPHGHRTGALIPRGLAGITRTIATMRAKRRGECPTLLQEPVFPNLYCRLEPDPPGGWAFDDLVAARLSLTSEPMNADQASTVASIHAAVASAVMTSQGTAIIRSATPWSPASVFETPLDSAGFASHAMPFDAYEAREIPKELADLLPQVAGLFATGTGAYRSLHLDHVEMWMWPEQRPDAIETMRVLAGAHDMWART